MKLKIFLTPLALLFTISVFAGPPVEEGRIIFKSRCAGCHNVNQVVVGPALAGVDKRRSMDWIINFVQSSQTVIKKGDKDAAALFAKFNNTPMPDHKDLSPENVKSVVEYIKSEVVAAPVDKAPFARPEKLRPAYIPISLSNYGFFTGYLIGVALLIFSLIFFVRVKEYQRNSLQEK
jgi:cytochrome c551/c552